MAYLDFIERHQTLSIVALSGAVATLLLSVATVGFLMQVEEWEELQKRHQKEVSYEVDIERP